MVTGATGFIGSHVARQLVADGWSVVALHRASTSRSALAELKATGIEPAGFASYHEIQGIARSVAPDAVFHLAAHQSRDPAPDEIDDFVATNITLGSHLLEGVAGSDCAVIVAMSYSQFWDSVPRPASMYSATKQAFLDVSRYFEAARGVRVRNVVLYDNYGAGDVRDKLITQLLTAARTASPIAMGPAGQCMNLLHVADVAAGLIAAAAPGNPPMMTVRAPTTVTVGELARLVERVTGVGLRKSHDESRSPSDQPLRSGDWMLPINWRAQWSLEDGLRQAAEAAGAIRRG